MSLKAKLLQYLKDSPSYVNGGTLEKYAESLGYKGSTGSRRCRDLVEENRITPHYRNGSVEYIYGSTQTAPKIEEPRLQQVEADQNDLFSQPYTRPIKMPDSWLSLKDKLRRRPHSTESQEARSGERPVQPTTDLSLPPFVKNLKYPQRSGQFLRKGA